MGASKKTIKTQRFYPFPVSVVWQAIATREALSEWLMQTDFEPTVGKSFRFVAQPMKGWRGYVECEVLEVVEHQRLVYSWQGMPEHHITTVTYELKPQKGGTLLVAQHDGFDQSHGFLAGIMLRAMLKAGWKKMFKRLLPQVLANIHGGSWKPISDTVRCTSD